MTTKLLLLFILFSVTTVYCDISNDFRLGIQLCDKGVGQNTGSIRYTPYFSEGGGWTVWAGDSNYQDPDGIRIGIFREAGNPFKVTSADFRLCIQLTDDASNSNGNSGKEGDIECTEWASKGGGWSAFAEDSNCKDFDAVRIKLDVDTSTANPPIIDNIRIGLQLSDSCTKSSKTGDAGYTDWIDDHTDAWTDYTGDSNFYDPDSVKIFLDTQGPSISHTEPIIQPDHDPIPDTDYHGFNDNDKYNNDYYYYHGSEDEGYMLFTILGLVVVLIVINGIWLYVSCTKGLNNKGKVEFDDYKV